MGKREDDYLFLENLRLRLLKDNETLSHDDANRLVDVVRRNEFVVIYPIKREGDRMRFCVANSIHSNGTISLNDLVTFSERQLPNGYDMFDVCIDGWNRERLKKMDIEVREREYYEPNKNIIYYG